MRTNCIWSTASIVSVRRSTLSERDRAALCEVVGEIHASSRVLAGYFRSGAEGRTEPSAADLDIVRELAPEARFILIAEPFRSGRVLVRKFERNAAGEWERTEQDSVASSSFERAPSAPPAPRRIVSRALPLVQQPIPVPILPVKTAALRTPARGARPAWFLAAGGVVLAAASGLGGYALHDRTGSAAPIKIVIAAPLLRNSMRLCRWLSSRLHRPAGADRSIADDHSVAGN